MKKIKGFTLIDVLFAVGFIAIVISVTTIGYSSLIKVSKSFSNSKNKSYEYRKLNLILENDFFESDSLIIERDKIIINKDSVFIKYNISDSHLIRTASGKTDSLKFNFEIREEKKIYYKLFNSESSLTLPLVTNKTLAIDKNIDQIEF